MFQLPAIIEIPFHLNKNLRLFDDGVVFVRVPVGIRKGTPSFRDFFRFPTICHLRKHYNYLNKCKNKKKTLTPQRSKSGLQLSLQF